MASQAVLIAETIAGMKKAVKRKAYDSDSDSSIEQLTNRGNKLRKKARYVREGQLAPPTGPLVYKRKIEHAGFYRDVISRNPRIVDEDGYEVDSEDEDERAEAAVAAAAEHNPYANIHIEDLLAPLTASSDLPDHPTLSRPFTSKDLTELSRQAGEMLQKEKASLWKIKHLLTRLSGDSTWVPCDVVETNCDFTLFSDERDRSRWLRKTMAGEADFGSTRTLISEEVDQPVGLLVDSHTTDADLDAAKKVVEKVVEAQDTILASLDDSIEPVAAVNGVIDKTTPILHETGLGKVLLNGQEDIVQNSAEAFKHGAMDADKSAEEIAHKSNPDPAEQELASVLGQEDQEEVPAPRRMRTRAQAQADSDNTTNSRTRSGSPDSISESFIHPYFLAPASSRPDRDVGLPPIEAEETRRLLQLYVQKQEEVCRGAEKVYNGLLKADRYRHMVIKWAKAEAHVGVHRDMSDGEDWYDKEEWMLDDDLKKGQDEEEEDAATTAKKTRTRRQ